LRHRDWQLAILVALGSCLILAATAPGIPIVWDEGDYLFRADRIIAWFHLLFDPRDPHGGLNALSSSVIPQYWLFVTWSEGHPAWFAVPIAFGKALLSGPLTPLTAARLGPIMVFGIACGAVALRLKHDYGNAAAVVGPFALLTLPRMFSDAHFATQDGQLTAWWLLLWAVDSSVRRSRRSAVAVGILLGLTCATKFTGFFAAVPVVFWRAVAQDRQRRRELLVLVPVALLTFYAVNPPLWHDPFAGLVEYFRLNLGRPDTNPFGIASSHVPDAWEGHSRAPIDFFHYVFGSMTDLRQAYYPWYNTVAWLVLATPVPTLMLGIVGLWRCISRRTEPSSFGLLLHWLILMIVRALPGAPSHDGIRLILPAFGFWCVLGGIGAQQLWDRASRPQDSAWRVRVIRSTLVVALGATAINVARYYPQTLSHYSLLVGGVRGAARIGMEPTYWWDALDDDVLNWLNAHAGQTNAIGFSQISDQNLMLLQTWGRLRTRVADLSSSPSSSFTLYVVQNRPGLLSDRERTLIRTEQPVYTKYAGHHADHVPPDLNVPLIVVFSYEQYQRAVVRSP
jgi:hypothetical protein